MKSDYHKGVTAGLALGKKRPSFRRYPHAMEHEIRDAVRKLEDKYREQIGDLACPITGEPAYMRVSWYRDGIMDALKYGRGAKFLIVRHGTPSYNLDSLVDRTVYDDPALAWVQSWKLDPEGHKYKGLDALYVNGAVNELGLRDVYGI